jgi:hypothetical protein
MRHSKKPKKKGPQRMKTTSKPSSEELARQAFESELNAFVAKVHGVIEDAREKMSDEERERADREAEAILRAATSGTRPSQHTA